MSEQNVTTDGERSTAPVYLVLTGDLMLDAPIAEAWVHVSQYWTWNHFAVRQHISGEPGQEGELVLLRKEEKGFLFPPYYARTIKVDPGRRMIAKTYPEKGTSEVDFFGFVDFSVHEQGERTRFCHNTIYEFLVPYKNESELEEFRRSQYANFDALTSSTFSKLKALCQDGSGDMK
jgi:hypothetical protein